MGPRKKLKKRTSPKKAPPPASEVVKTLATAEKLPPYTGISGNPQEQVVVVKVQRASVGAKIPFDKIYFFPKSAAARISSIFGYALVLPLDSSLMMELEALAPSTVSHYGDRRDDDKVKQPVKDYNASWWHTQIFSRYAPENRLVVVPILTSTLRKKINPAYLMSTKWFDSNPVRKKPARARRNRFKTPLPVLSPISDSAYLATPLDAPHDKISPICSICPRLLMQMQGECYPGQLVCLKTLDFNAITTSKPVPDDAVDATDEVVEETL
jgi:hypothetical protein